MIIVIVNTIDVDRVRLHRRHIIRNERARHRSKTTRFPSISPFSSLLVRWIDEIQRHRVWKKQKNASVVEKVYHHSKKIILLVNKSHEKHRTNHILFILIFFSEFANSLARTFAEDDHWNRSTRTFRNTRRNQRYQRKISNRSRNWIWVFFRFLAYSASWLCIYLFQRTIRCSEMLRKNERFSFTRKHNQGNDLFSCFFFYK